MKPIDLLISCALWFSLPLAVWTEEPQPPDWVAGLASEDYAERKATMEKLEANRTEIISHLIPFLQRPVRRGEPFYGLSTPRNMAIHLLGIYRAEEAIPFLIEHLAMEAIQDATRDNPLTPVPAARALHRIGSAARPMLIETLKTTTNVLITDQCVKLLFEMEGIEAGTAIREELRMNAIPTEARVLSLLDALENRRSNDTE